MSTKWDIKLYLRDLQDVHKPVCFQLKAHMEALVMNVFSMTLYNVYRRANQGLQNT